MPGFSFPVPVETKHWPASGCNTAAADQDPKLTGLVLHEHDGGLCRYSIDWAGFHLGYALEQLA